MPAEKEPHYFATDMPVYRRMVEEEKYLALFSEATSAHNAIGEASVWYLYSDDALGKIRNFQPDARIMVFFRNPVDFVQSLHAQFAYNNGRDPDFLAAWKNPKSRDRLIKAGAFGTQFEKLRKLFAPEQRLVILQDDLKEAPRREYLRALEFLGLEDDGRTDFSTFNANKVHRSPGLARFAKRTPAPIDRAWRQAKRLLGIRQLGLMERIHKLNTKPVRRPGIPEQLRLEVHAAFADEIRSLGSQIQRDLSHWR